MMKSLSVVIPMYNSEKTISTVVDEIVRVLDSLKEYKYEIILVDDCGKDHALNVAREMAKHNTMIKIIELAKNAGQANAMFAGYQYCSGDFIISMDDDGQHPADAIPSMLNKMILEDYDVVFARFQHPQRTLVRRIGSYINQKLSEIIIDKPGNIDTNSFFIMKKIVCEKIIEYPHTHPNVYGVIFATTSHVANVDVKHRKRLYGNSNYSFFPLCGIWLGGFFCFNDSILHIIATLGFIITGISMIVGIGIFISVFFSSTVKVPGWTSMILTIIFFAGIQLLSIGVLGEYVGRMFVTDSKLPNYMVRHTVNIKEIESHINNI